MPDSLAPSARIIALPTACIVSGITVAAAGGALAGCALLSLPVMLGIAATAFGSMRLAHTYATYLSLEQRIIAKLDNMTAKNPDEMRSYIANGRLNLTEAIKIARNHGSLERQGVLRLIEKALLQMGKCLEAASATPQTDDDTASTTSTESDRISLISSGSTDSIRSTQSPPLEAWDLALSPNSDVFEFDMSSSTSY